MKKNILSVIALVSFGLAVNAQTFEIYEGAQSSTNIAGTTVNAAITGDQYEQYFYVKNTGSTTIETNIRRVNILSTSSEVTYGICWGVTEGACYPPMATATYTTPSSGAASLNASNRGEITTEVNFESGANQPVHFRYYIEDTDGIVYDSLDIKVNTTLGVKEVKNAVSFNTYPNPANDVVNVTVQGSTDNAIKMIDVLGNVVAEDKFGASKKLDVSQLKNGVYLLTIYSGGKMVQTKRIVVRH